MSKYAKTKEPPCTERYARWCERSVGKTYLLLDLAVGGLQLAENKQPTTNNKVHRFEGSWFKAISQRGTFEEPEKPEHLENLV